MSLLANLCAVPGVSGAALYTDDGRCIESRLVAPYEPEHVFDVTRQLLISLESLTFIDEAPVRQFMARLSEGAMAIMRGPTFVLAALAERTVNPMMLNVALGALEGRLAKMPGLSVPPPVQSSLVPRPPMDGSAPASLVSVSDFTLDASQLRAQPVGDVVDLATMKRLLGMMSRCIGPMSKLVMKRELKRMGRSSSALPRSEFRHFVERIARNIQRPDLKDEFLRQSAGLTV